MKVKNVIISKQAETSENFSEFLDIVNGKNINVIAVNKGDKILVEKNLYFDIIWPDNSDFISENSLNNNALVCKLCYKDFSCIFTGDIEEITEKKLIKLYSNTNALSATVLKVAHHGSKTSSIKEFLDKVKPLYALIGVGKNNKFGHPSDNTIKKLKYINTIVYRTDINGEIILTTDGEKIWKKTLVKSK